MAIVKKWSGDGLSPGVVTTSTAGTGDSPFDLFNGDPGGTYPNVVASGPRSPQLEFPTANSKSAAPVWTLPTMTASAGRFYITTPAAWNSATHAITQIQSGTATICARLSLSGSSSPGQLRVYNSSATQVANTPSNTLALSTRYRVEWTLDQVAGVLTAKVFLGDETTALATLAPSSSFGTSCDRVVFGAYNTAVVPLMQFDDFAIANTADFIGPAGSAPITASPSSIATAEAFGSPAAIDPWDLTNPGYKGVALQFVSTAENGTLDWSQGYAYIEYGAGIGDNRGYTAGLAGWTTATFDLNVLLKHYRDLAPGNILEKWIDELDAIDAMATQQARHEASLTMLGQPFVNDWVYAATNDPLFRQAQREERDAAYWDPAYAAAVADGLSPLGLLAYYDVGVNHGYWADDTVGGQSFNGIILTAKSQAAPPSQGGNEETYLTAVFDARWAVLQDWGDAQTDGRDPALRSLVAADEWGLVPPISWSMYGTPYTVTAYPAEPVEVYPSGIAGAEAFGTPTVMKSQRVSPAGITSSEAFGAPAASWPVQASVAGIATKEAFGSPTLVVPITARPQGFARSTLFGSPTAAVQDLTQTVSPGGIAPAGAFGTPAATYGAVVVKPTGIQSLEAFGTLRGSSIVVLKPANIPSLGNNFGTPTIRATITLGPVGLGSLEALGTPSAVKVVLQVSPAGVVTAESFGAPRALGGSQATPYEMNGAMGSRSFAGRLGRPDTTSLKPNRWEGTLG